MQIDIKPDDVDAMVKDALLKSSFGKIIQETMAKAFSGYDNPFERQIKAVVGEMCGQILREKYTTQIRELVSSHIEKNVTQELLQKMTDTAITKIIRAAESDY